MPDPARFRHSVVLSLLLLRAYPQARRPWLYRLARLGVAGVYLYLVLALGLLAAEDLLAFNPAPATAYWTPPPPGLDPGDIELTSADGTELHAWWSEPMGWTPQQGALLLCHGQGGNLSSMGRAALQWRDLLGVAVLLFDYPGFGYSAGSPSETGIYAAADAAYDWMVSEKRVPATRVLIMGQSLGGGVAVDLASRRPHRALLLFSTFTSFPEAAQSTLHVFPARWLAHNQFRNDEKIGKIATPVFVVHGTADRTIPYWQGERLFAAVTSEHKRFVRVDGGTHNLIDRPEVLKAACEFLAGND